MEWSVGVDWGVQFGVSLESKMQSDFLAKFLVIFKYLYPLQNRTPVVDSNVTPKSYSRLHSRLH